jgi:diacylglycerol kinase family enzyme
MGRARRGGGGDRGGDGTIRSAARALLGSRVALGILPLGTLNRLAHDLAIPFEPAAAAAALATGVRTAIDVAEVNGEIFLCNSMLGLPPRFARHRQFLRGKAFAARAAGYWRVLREFLASRHRITVELEDEHSIRRVRALSLVVSNNVYGAEPSTRLLRESLSQGKLGIYVSLHESGRHMAMAVVRAMMGRWKSDPDLEFGKARRLKIHAPHRKRIRVSNDGEVTKLVTPLSYMIRPQALVVIEPSPANPAHRLRGRPVAAAGGADQPADVRHDADVRHEKMDRSSSGPLSAVRAGAQ